MRPTEPSTERPANSSREDAARTSSGARSHMRRLSVRSVLAAMLVVYWASLFFGTHASTVPKGLAKFGDKVLHFGGYAGLAALLMGWRASRGRFGWKTTLVLWLMLAAYGAFDEITQIPVGRHADVADWLADLAGAACGIGFTALMARRICDRHRNQSTPAGSNVAGSGK